MVKDPGYFGIKSFIKTGNLFGLQHIYGDMTNSTGVDPIDFSGIECESDGILDRCNGCCDRNTGIFSKEQDETG